MGMASNCTGTVNDTKRFAARGQGGRRHRLSRCRAVRAPLCHRRAGPGRRHRGLLGLQVVRSAPGRALGPRGAAEGNLRLQGAAGGRRACRTSSRPARCRTRAWRAAWAPSSISSSSATGETRAKRISSAWDAMAAYEQKLTLKLIEGLRSFKGLTDPRHHLGQRHAPPRAHRVLHAGRPPSRRPWPRPLPRTTSSSGPATTTPSSP